MLECSSGPPHPMKTLNNCGPEKELLTPTPDQKHTHPEGVNSAKCDTRNQLMIKQLLEPDHSGSEPIMMDTNGVTPAEVTPSRFRRFTKGLIRFPSMRRKSSDGSSRTHHHKGAKNGDDRRTDRTSRMLMAVLSLFLLTEFPQGIIHLLSGWYGPKFFRCYYNTTAEVWDFLALINSATNFILYCFMSKQFRTQFSLSLKAIQCYRKSKWSSVSHCTNNATVSTTV